MAKPFALRARALPLYHFNYPFQPLYRLSILPFFYQPYNLRLQNADDLMHAI
jgi:hypothetical protein